MPHATTMAAVVPLVAERSDQFTIKGNYLTSTIQFYTPKGKYTYVGTVNKDCTQSILNVPQDLADGNYTLKVYKAKNKISNGVGVFIYTYPKPVNETCTDSDGGINYYVKGYVATNYNGQDINNKVYDSCMIPDAMYPGQLIGVPSCSGADCQVEDFYCIVNAGPYGSFSNCPNGCYDGACFRSSTNSTNSTR